MRLSWNEIRVRAADFAREYADAGYEKGETQLFYSAFFEVFGVRGRTVVRYEKHVRKLDDSRGYIDLFWPGARLRSCSAGSPPARCFPRQAYRVERLTENASRVASKPCLRQNANASSFC